MKVEGKAVSIVFDLHVKSVKISQRELGEALNITQGMVSRYLRGRVNITLGFLEKLAEALNARLTEENYHLTAISLLSDIEAVKSHFSINGYDPDIRLTIIKEKGARKGVDYVIGYLIAKRFEYDLN